MFSEQNKLNLQNVFSQKGHHLTCHKTASLTSLSLIEDIDDIFRHFDYYETFQLSLRDIECLNYKFDTILSWFFEIINQASLYGHTQ